MKFANILFGHLFWLVVLLVLFYLWVFKKRKEILGRFADKELLKELTVSFDKRKQRFKIVLIILGVIFIIFSLMRPQWGFHWEEVKRTGLDIIIALDTSKSMLAEDVKPNRLKRSQLAIKDLVKKLKGDRIGLIAFSGSAFLSCPLTLDYNGFLLSLDTMGVNIIPKGGTSISSAIKEAMKSYEGGQKKYKVLVIITDGEDHLGDPVGVAQDAQKEGIKMFCIGIGSKEGDLIPVVDENGDKGFLKDRQGNVVKSRLNEAALSKIALATGGSYVRSSATEFGLDMIYEQKLSQMEKRNLKSKMERHYEERFQIFLAIAFVLLLIELLISERR